ncbi:hypothetical protein [Synechococcus sp. UW140]|uniref:hypothetical protein n=1 Tax=Synechococcus sp. UW140 TaxID=368503 RepID=UPI003137D433
MEPDFLFLATRTAELFCERAAGIAGDIWEKLFPLDSKQKQVLAYFLRLLKNR